MCYALLMIRKLREGAHLHGRSARTDIAPSISELTVQPALLLLLLLLRWRWVKSCFFNVQPASGLLEEEDLGVHWSNFVGICLFHSGNLVSTYDMRNMFNSNRMLRACQSSSAYLALPSIGPVVHCSVVKQCVGAMITVWFILIPTISAAATIPRKWYSHHNEFRAALQRQSTGDWNVDLHLGNHAAHHGRCVRFPVTEL